MSARSLTWTLATTLLLAMPLGAAAGDPETESAAEQALARAAEEDPAAFEQAPPAVPEGVGVGGPLFIGVDDVTISTYRVDVVTNGFTPLFTGFQAWGAAYDPVGDQVFLNNGATLYVWPVGGSVSTLGTIVDGAGASQAIVGLAFYNGTLYGCKNIANEAVYTINTTTLLATVHIDYADADFDCGGLAADPVTGDIYMTNDDTTPFGSGLFRMNLDGTGTLITPYPAGQTDIDGLAIGGGRAYLVTDEPGFIYVWDFGAAAYQTPLNNPWTTAEVFSAGAWIAPAPVGEPAISLAKTVGTDPGVCAATDQIVVANGTNIYYCFEVTNTGSVTLGLHDLVDSHLGTILSGFLYDLVPGASFFLLVQDVADATVTNTATWTAAIIDGQSAEAEDSATVVVLDTLIEIPTLSGLGLGALILVLAMLGLMLLRRRRTA